MEVDALDNKHCKVKDKAKTVSKTLGDVQAEVLIDTSPDLLSEVEAKIIADTLTCVEAASPVKTESDTHTGVKANKVVDN